MDEDGDPLESPDAGRRRDQYPIHQMEKPLETLFVEVFSFLVRELVVEIDAPRLEYFRVGDHRVASFVLKNVGALVEADIDTAFSLNYDKSFDPSDVHKRNVIRGFLVGISKVKDMTIASSTLEVIYEYSRYEPLPLFRNLTFLRVEFYGDMWEMLPVFLESCLNLKDLATSYRGKDGVHILFQPQCFLSSLEYVEIDGLFKGEAMEMKLVSYLRTRKFSRK
ncbi:hypothetical protein F2Q68_00046676 [Brassica cretica]|uniref:FBD domain-containing protein n=1 Tax=Brassica cretica TaxID=69181 RepID=A0A8S9LTV8_BRACR|nr:hypothetical protein F2Q68_00046676 [Brassica cretica]